MTGCSFQPLDHRAIEHLRDVLSYGKPLGKLFLACNRLERGQVLALLPPGNIGDPYRFNQTIVRQNPAPKIPTPGGYLQATASTNGVVHGWLDNVFRSDLSLALVGESFLLRAYTNRLADPGRVLTYNDFLYYVGVQGDDYDVMDACIGCIGTVPPGCGFLWSAGESASTWIHRSPGMDEELQKSITTNARAMLIGAYDGDSFLVWVPEGTTLDLRLPDVFQP